MVRSIARQPLSITPDHVAVVMHNYRWRLRLTKGESKYVALERGLQHAALIAVPTITIGSDFGGATADGKAYRSRFSGRYEQRTSDGIGHNVPQEASGVFAQAVIDVDYL